ncbi:VOC family protein [Pseudofrankia inefficax]|uniref:Glyoxalase/bleomycin resistance protein/dioxygenase n=1 Tax=Pseudofrankia inefficax (strain DSM 45817 / CECT 9037 / DDB 130130 / EuI1c) TaxID=298654 RepID=E3IV94_PSEI1|nr:VOC family protein [Pseudofrankia inefficax]ADP81258.1 Glyoxalase/bleomycin resistance protein/dioxygenase [Pseudofrankia inefficax]
MISSAAGSIGDRIRRISHVVVNVSDLDRSVQFYEKVSPLRLVTTFEAPEQSFEPLRLGCDRARFVAAVLEDQTGGDPVAVHLVQWVNPPPTGAAYRTFLDSGITKLGICYPDPERKRAQLREAGAVLTNEKTVRNYFTTTDPDGIFVSFINLPGTVSERLFHTCLAMTAPVDQTVRFYRDVLGLEHWMRVAVPEPVPASLGAGSDLGFYESHFFRGWGDHRFSLDCSKNFLPYAQAAPPREAAHHIGIARFAIEVDDVGRCFDVLRAASAGLDHGPVGAGPVRWVYGPPFGPRRVLVVRDPSGHLFELFTPEQRPFLDRAPGTAQAGHPPAAPSADGG